jgi:DHA2 family multidrug resistance protein
MSVAASTGTTPSPSPHMSARQANGLLLGLGLATAMQFYTFDSVNLILPDMAGALGVSRDEASWILTVYSSALFFGVPLSIYLARRIGVLRYLLGSIAVFCVASLGCAAARSLDAMLFWRAIQGLAGAGLTVWWRASVYMLMPKAERGRSLMRVSVMLYLSTVIGLLLSGYLTDNIDWRLIFLPNLACAVGASWLLLRHFPKVEIEDQLVGTRTDRLGIVLLGVALISVQVILSRGEIDNWFASPVLQSLGWTGGSALLVFVWWQFDRSNRAPLLRVGLIRERNVLASAALGVFTGIILSGSLYALPEYLRGVDPQARSATQTGALMCVYALTAAAIRPLVTWSIARVGQRKAIVFALTMLVASMLLISRFLTTGTPTSDYILPLALYACCLTPLLSAVGGGTVARVVQQDQLDAISIYMTFRQFGTSLGVALVSIILTRRETLHSARLFDHLRPGRPIVHDWILRASDQLAGREGLGFVDAGHAALGVLREAASRQAEALAYADAFLFMAAIGVATFFLLPLMAPTPVKRP